MSTATLVKELPVSRSGATQALYRLDPPLEGCEYVVCSAVFAMCSGPETYIFPADASGKIVSWGQLDGSYSGDLDHETALRNAGYDVEAQS